MSEDIVKETLPQDIVDCEDPYAAEALRKINAEMLQLDNHRFLLTTTAVIFVGTAAGWTTTTFLHGTSMGSEMPTLVQCVPPAVLLLVWVVLFVLFHYQLSLARTVRWLAAYQMHRGSAWEWTWHGFRLKDSAGAPVKDSGAVPFAAHQVITTVFNFLFVASFFYFLLLQLAVASGPDLLRWSGSYTRVLVIWGVLLVLLPALILTSAARTRAVLGSRVVNEEKQYRQRWREAAAEGYAARKEEYPTEPFANEEA